MTERTVPARSRQAKSTPGSSSAGVELPFSETRQWKDAGWRGQRDIKYVTEQGETAVRLTCRNASFSVNREVRIDVRETPLISWKWKVESIPAAGDVRVSSRNDQALQVLVGFEGSKVLSYVWDSNAPVGHTEDEHHGIWGFRKHVKVKVLESGSQKLDQWIAVERNLATDFRDTFKADPGLVEGVRVQTNCQHTKSTGSGTLFGLRFKGF